MKPRSYPAVLILLAALAAGCGVPAGKDTESPKLRVAVADLVLRAEGSRPPLDKPPFADHPDDRAIPPHFQLKLEVENLTAEEMKLSRPKIDGGVVRFAVTRWYEEGDVGLEWDGALKSKEKKQIQVIGNLGGTVTPGREVTAKITLGPLELTKKTTVLDGEHQKCPCGCDRSEAMVAELRKQGGVPAREAIRKALADIARRERRGYVTEQMIAHRLRLLALEGELGR
jgi:hypothetical protein